MRTSARADRVQVDHRREIAHVGVEVVVPVRGRRAAGALERNSRHAAEAVGEQRVGALLDPAGDVRVGGPAVRRVVLEAAVLRRVVRRRDHDAVGEPAAPAAVVGEDRVRHDRRRRVAVRASTMTSTPFAASTSSAVAKAGSESACVSIPDEQRAVDRLALAVEADRLRDREDVGLVERGVERGAAMPGGPERDALRGHGRIGPSRVVGVDEPGARRRGSMRGRAFRRAG